MSRSLGRRPGSSDGAPCPGGDAARRGDPPVGNSFPLEDTSKPQESAIDGEIVEDSSAPYPPVGNCFPLEDRWWFID